MLHSLLRPALSPALRSPLEPAVGGSAPPLSLTAQVQAIAQISGRVAALFDTQDLTTMYTTRAGSTLIGTPGNGTAQFVGRWEDISGDGHHALAPNDTTGRPQLSARVNLFERSQNFANAYWTKNRCAVTNETEPDPDGGNAAALITCDGTTGLHGLIRTSGIAPNTGTTLRVTVHPGTSTFLQFSYAGDTTSYLNINATTGAITATVGTVSGVITTLAGGWLLCVLTNTSAAVTGVTVSAHITGTDSRQQSSSLATNFKIYTADLRPTNIHAAGSIPAYQRVTAAEDYDSVGFPYRFIPNGTGQGFTTSTITPGSDTVTVVSGIRITRDSATEVFQELSASADLNTGSLYLLRLSTNVFRMLSRGSGSGIIAATGAILSPRQFVLTGSGQISAPSVRVAPSGESEVTVTASQGTGNYSAHSLNLFGRSVASGGSLWFGGQGFRQFICFGPALSAGELATVEPWVNESTKAY